MISIDRFSIGGGHAACIFSGDCGNHIQAKCGRTKSRRRQHGGNLSSATTPFCNINRGLKLRQNTVCASKNGNDKFGGSKKQDRRTTLLNYVQEVEPQVMEQFVDTAPPQVVAAMRQTINNLLGTLPPQFFTVRVSTVAENLAQLMYSVMMTGYMFRNTQYRMELKNTMGLLAKPTSDPNNAWPTTSKGSIVASPQLPPSTTSLASPSQPTLPSLKPYSSMDSNSSTNGTGKISPISSTGSSINTASSSLQSSISGSIGAGSSDATTSSRGNSSSVDSTSSTSGSGVDVPEEDEYAPGVQKTRVQGEVLRWHLKNGLETMPAVEYMEMLEGEVAELKQQLAAQAAPPPRSAATAAAATAAQSTLRDEGKNELLEYLKTLDPHSMQELTAGAGDEVSEAMNSFIHRLLGTKDKEQLRKAASDCTANELGKLLFWLMVVGYTLRTLEVRYDMERSLDISFESGNKELPPGR